MDCYVFLCLFIVVLLQANAQDEMIIDRIINIIQRRHSGHKGPIIIGAPRNPEDLPRAEPILPGHTLLRPTMTMLKSSVKYPLRDVKSALVYGNLDNLGITYDKTSHRLLYTDFRKSNDVLKTILKAITNINKSNGEKSNEPLIILEATPAKPKDSYKHVDKIEDIDISEDTKENEIVDDEEPIYGESREIPDYRRKAKKKKHRDRTKHYKSSSSSSSEDKSSSSDSSDQEKNPGNPFTLHKNKYKQNWLWNHFMDGDHMNVNPFAPQMKDVGPTGAQLFFGRKWWYFNQDDYKPL